MTTTKPKTTTQVEISLPDMVGFICDAIAQDLKDHKIPSSEKCLLALELQKAKMLLHTTIISLTTCSKGDH